MTHSSESILGVRRSDGSVDIASLARTLGVTEAELAESVELSGQETSDIQYRLNVLVELLERVMPWSGDFQTAYDWYCSQPIAGFGDTTAQDLLKEGRASAVHAYLDRIADGGYA